MAIIDLLASSQGLKGNAANIALANEIASSNNKSAIKELVENLQNSDKKIQGDCIKTLYETGYIKPELISEYCNDFLQLLKSKNNRLVWSGMIAISVITDLKPEEIFASLDLIMQTVNEGSVITIDNGVEILAKLNRHKEYSDITGPLLREQLSKCPIKQLPMYAEKVSISKNGQNKAVYLNIIRNRINECEKESQKKRLEKILKQLN